MPDTRLCTQYRPEPQTSQVGDVCAVAAAVSGLRLPGIPMFDKYPRGGD
jgi:hypothetical protein